jgi:hypothetical protein
LAGLNINFVGTLVLYGRPHIYNPNPVVGLRQQSFAKLFPNSIRTSTSSERSQSAGSTKSSRHKC